MPDFERPDDDWLASAYPHGDLGSVSAMLSSPARIQKTILRLTEQKLLMDELFPPPPPLTGWRRWWRKISLYVHDARESLAIKIAPWLWRP